MVKTVLPTGTILWKKNELFYFFPFRARLAKIRYYYRKHETHNLMLISNCRKVAEKSREKVIIANLEELCVFSERLVFFIYFFRVNGYEISVKFCVFLKQLIKNVGQKRT